MTFAVPLIVGVVQVIKNVGLPSKYAPPVAIVLGIGASFLIGQSGAIETVDWNYADYVLAGIISGLGSVGLYSTAQTYKD